MKVDVDELGPARTCAKQHRSAWSLQGVRGARWLWCPDCGAVRLVSSRRSWRLWIYPVGDRKAQVRLLRGERRRLTRSSFAGGSVRTG